MDNTSHKESWSKRYKERGDELGQPSGYTKKHINYFKDGSLLDLACGDGRNSVFLAENGFNVTGVDFSEEAIKRLIRFSKLKNLQVKSKILDVNNPKELIELGKFDNIIINNFKPTKEVFHILPSLLNKDGILLICTFNYRHSEKTDFPREYCLEENELVDISDDLILIRHDLIEREKADQDGYIFKLK